jgi:hypothetical protein
MGLQGLTYSRLTVCPDSVSLHTVGDLNDLDSEVSLFRHTVHHTAPPAFTTRVNHGTTEVGLSARHAEHAPEQYDQSGPHPNVVLQSYVYANCVVQVLRCFLHH